MPLVAPLWAWRREQRVEGYCVNILVIRQKQRGHERLHSWRNVALIVIPEFLWPAMVEPTWAPFRSMK